MSREEIERFLTDEGRAKVAAFLAEADAEDDDFDLDEVLRQNLLEATRGWTVPDGTPVLPNGMPQTMTAVADGSWTRKYNIRNGDGH